MLTTYPAANQSRRPLLQCLASVVSAAATVSLVAILTVRTTVSADDEASTNRHVVLLTQKGKDKANEILAEQLREETGFKCTVLVAVKQSEDQSNDRKPMLHVFPGIEVIKEADLLVMDIRRKSLPKEQLDLIRGYLDAGKPFVGFRQASHAFEVSEVPEGGAVWPTFDIDVLGCDYRGHGRKGTRVTIEPKNAEHPILRGVTTEPWVSESPIYAEGTEEKDAVVLWWGHQKDRTEAIAWTRLYKGKGRIFYTSLGVQENVEQPQFRRLAINGMLWALDEPTTE